MGTSSCLAFGCGPAAFCSPSPTRDAAGCVGLAAGVWAGAADALAEAEAAASTSADA